MVERAPAPPEPRGIRFLMALGAGALAFTLVLVSMVLIEWLHPNPEPRHALLALGVAGFAGVLGALAGGRAGGAIAGPVDDLRRALAASASAAPPPPLPLDAPGEIGRAARAVAAMTRALQLARDDLASAASRIHAESLAIHEAASRRSSQSQAEADSIQRTNAVAEEIAQSSQRTLQQAGSVIDAALRSEELSADGARVVAGAVRATGALQDQVRRVTEMVSELSERSSQIAEIVVTVQDLAEQTDLVALNASVEAAKAGEQGRGFAVVAMEMRQLAEQSRQAATQVRAILGEIDRGAQVSASATEEAGVHAQEAQHLARSAGEALEALVLLIRRSGSAAREIADAARRQTEDVQGVASSIGELVAAASAGAEDARALEHSSRALAELSRGLAVRTAATGPPPTPGPGA